MTDIDIVFNQPENTFAIFFRKQNVYRNLFIIISHKYAYAFGSMHV